MLSPEAQLGLLTVPAYLVGAVPFGLLVARTRGVDPRKAGSGNIGATNVARLLGTRYFFIVFALDLLKGLAPVLAGALLIRGAAPSAALYATWLAVALAAIVGHMAPVYIGFKGGKGVATSAGVLLGIWPYFTLPAAAGLAVFAAAFALWRYVSLASIMAAAAFPLAYIAIGLASGWPIFSEQAPLLGFAFLVAFMVIWRHRTNIARLRAGTESRAGKKPPAAA